MRNINVLQHVSCADEDGEVFLGFGGPSQRGCFKPDTCKLRLMVMDLMNLMDLEVLALLIPCHFNGMAVYQLNSYRPWELALSI